MIAAALSPRESSQHLPFPLSSRGLFKGRGVYQSAVSGTEGIGPMQNPSCALLLDKTGKPDMRYSVWRSLKPLVFALMALTGLFSMSITTAVRAATTGKVAWRFKVLANYISHRAD